MPWNQWCLMGIAISGLAHLRFLFLLPSYVRFEHPVTPQPLSLISTSGSRILMTKYKFDVLMKQTNSGNQRQPQQEHDAQSQQVQSPTLLHNPDSPSPQTKKSRIAILGLYNSGSTALANILSILGVDMGDVNWAYEDTSMVSFLSAAWDEPYGNPKIYSPEQRVQRLHDWMMSREDSTNSTQVGLKHPLLSLSAPDALAAWGNDTLFVWAHRPLSKSIAGLNRRQWFAPAHLSKAHGDQQRANIQTKLWRALRAFFECGPDGGDGDGAAAADVAGCRAHRPLVVSYAALLKDAHGEVQKIADALGLHPTEDAIARAEDLILSYSGSR